MPSPQDFAERLREQAYKTLSPQIQDLEQELQNVTSSLSEGVQQIERRLEALLHIELPTTEPVLEEFLGEAFRQNERETGDLAHFARAVRRLETQEEILTSLLDSAQKCFPRIALYVIRGNRLVGWSSRGYSESLARNISSSAFDRSACPRFQEALESGNPSVIAELPEDDSLQLLEQEAKGPWHLLPLRALQRPVAILLAGSNDGIPVRPDSLSILTDLAVLQLENTALRILYELTAAEPVAASQPVPQEASEPEPVPAEEASPEFAPGQEIAVHEEAEEPAIEQLEPVLRAEPVQEPGSMEEAVPTPEGEETLEAQAPVEHEIHAPEAEEALEAQAPAEEEVPAPEAEETLEAQAPAEEEVSAPEVEETLEAQAPAEEEVPAPEGEEALEAQAPAEEEVSAPEAEETLEAQAPEEEAVAAPQGGEPFPEEIQPEEAQPQAFPQIPAEEKLHSDAKRFARLLVSEIKLYNERHVTEGRENQDIYIRLKRDIDRSREMYEKRVSPTVSRKIDYFHDEIIRILGDNDPSALGSDYPGPRVEI